MSHRALALGLGTLLQLPKWPVISSKWSLREEIFRYIYWWNKFGENFAMEEVRFTSHLTPETLLETFKWDADIDKFFMTGSRKRFLVKIDERKFQLRKKIRRGAAPECVYRGEIVENNSGSEIIGGFSDAT
jgi:hypothetical protein